MEERYGQWASPHFGVVLAANVPWLLLPFAVILRLWRDHPFSRPATAQPSPAEQIAAVTP
jgi:hypothetical protein